MRIVHIASDDSWGGAERVVSLLVEGTLARSGFEVEVILFNSGRLAETLRALGAQVHIISEQSLSLPRLVLAIDRLLSGRAVDVIHAHRYKEMLVAALVAVRRHCRLVVTVHGLEPLSQLKISEALKIWASLFIARLARARFVAVSKELEKRLVRGLGRHRVVAIPNPLPTIKGEATPDLRELLGWHPTRPVIGFIGRLETVKGPDYFLDLAAQSDGQVGFVMVGTGAEYAKLAQRISSEGLTGRVALLGEVPDATSYLRQMDVLAVTSRHEGLPMVVLEAAACEVPVVAFDVGGLQEVLDSSPAARLVPPDDLNQFQMVIQEVLRNRACTRKAVAIWANGIISRFNLQTITGRYLAVYCGEQ